jgi:hypothetical protein
VIRAHCEQFVVQWHALRAALHAMRDEENGMATLEVVFLAAGLFALATATVLLIRHAFQHHSASIT